MARGAELEDTRGVMILDPVAHETRRDRNFERAVIISLQRQTLEPAAEHRLAEFLAQPVMHGPMDRIPQGLANLRVRQK